MKRYLVLLGVALGVAASLALLTRLPRSGRVEPATAALPMAALRLVIERGAIVPELGAVPKDHEVALAIENRDADSVAVVLAGYEDLLPPAKLAPGETWSARFVSSRPGDDFAWWVDGRPAGRLRVTGSHLEEGHR